MWENWFPRSIVHGDETHGSPESRSKTYEFREMVAGGIPALRRFFSQAAARCGICGGVEEPLASIPSPPCARSDLALHRNANELTNRKQPRLILLWHPHITCVTLLLP